MTANVGLAQDYFCDEPTDVNLTIVIPTAKRKKKKKNALFTNLRETGHGCSTPSSVDVHDAVEESPEEYVGKESSEQAGRQKGGPAPQELVPGGQGADDQHEPEGHGRHEVEEKPPQTRQTQDACRAAGKSGKRSAAVFEHGTVVAHRGFAVRHHLAGLFLLGADFLGVVRHRRLLARFRTKFT
ncbi:unnamed protein product [Ixodes persulcatus]